MRIVHHDPPASWNFRDVHIAKPGVSTILSKKTIDSTRYTSICNGFQSVQIYASWLLFQSVNRAGFASLRRNAGLIFTSIVGEFEHDRFVKDSPLPRLFRSVRNFDGRKTVASRLCRIAFASRSFSNARCPLSTSNDDDDDDPASTLEVKTKEEFPTGRIAFVARGVLSPAFRSQRTELVELVKTTKL